MTKIKYMIELTPPEDTATRHNRLRRAKIDLTRYKKLACMGKISAGIINDLCSPIDAANRFINLSLQTTEENSQSREFLLESKQGIRKALQLIKRLNAYAKKIEREVVEISATSQKRQRINIK